MRLAVGHLDRNGWAVSWKIHDSGQKSLSDHMGGVSRIGEISHETLQTSLLKADNAAPTFNSPKSRCHRKALNHVLALLSSESDVESNGSGTSAMKAGVNCIGDSLHSPSLNQSR